MSAAPTQTPREQQPAVGGTVPRDWRFWVLAACVILCLWSPAWLMPPVALGLGVVLALSGLVPRGWQASKVAKLVIQCSVVLLGFGMDLHQVLRAGVDGMALAAGTIVLTLALGVLIGRALRTDRTVTALVSSGTAICGGSAIASVGSVIGAGAVPMGVAMGTVFLLNALAVLAFPHIGVWLGLSAQQYGTWAAIAVHDIAGVAGAADGFDRLAHTSPEAVTVATAVKLARTLWIIPLCAYFAWQWRRTGEHVKPGSWAGRVPWFIAVFLLAAGARTLWPMLAERVQLPMPIGMLGLVDLGKRGMLVALLLIGAGLSLGNLKQVGWRPLALGGILWIMISVVGLLAVRVMVR